MDQKPKGPYKHVERPSESRVNSHDDNMGSSRWGAVIIILIVIIIALIPIVHKFASNRADNQAQTVQTSKKSSVSSKKNKASKAKNKANKSKKQSNTANSSSSSLMSSSTASSSSATESSSSSSSAPKVYVVQEGDTLSSIASDHGMSVSALAELNDLDSDSGVEAGQTLKLHDEQ